MERAQRRVKPLSPARFPSNMQPLDQKAGLLVRETGQCIPGPSVISAVLGIDPPMSDAGQVAPSVHDDTLKPPVHAIPTEGRVEKGVGLYLEKSLLICRPNRQGFFPIRNELESVQVPIQLWVHGSGEAVKPVHSFGVEEIPIVDPKTRFKGDESPVEGPLR
jgi:hypothetical protein